MKIQHLRFFAAVVDSGGVIKAAERLHLSQPAVSAGLKALEQDLGCALFERSRGSRRIRLTSAGQRFHLRALAILKECDAARAELQGQEKRAQRWRLGVLDTLPEASVAAMLSALRAAHREQRIDLWEGTAARLAGWLGQERIDAAVTVVEEATPNVHVLWREPFVAVVAPNHPLAKSPRATITVRDLAAEPFVFRSRCEMSPVGQAQLRAAGVTLRVVVRAEREELAFRLVAQNVGITLAPRSIVPGYLVPLAVNGLSLARTVGLQWRSNLDPGLVAEVRRVVMEAADIPPHSRARRSRIK